MQVTNPCIPITFKCTDDLLLSLWLYLVIEQHPAGATYETNRPVNYQKCAQHSHERVHPDELKKLGAKQSDYCQDRGQGIGEYMQVGCFKILVGAFGVRVDMLLRLLEVCVIGVGTCIIVAIGHGMGMIVGASDPLREIREQSVSNKDIFSWPNL